MEINGHYFNGRNSAAHPAQIHIADNFVNLRCKDQAPQLLSPEKLEFADPIGNIKRSVSWYDDEVLVTFQTDDLKAFDSWAKSSNQKNTAFFIHFLEGHIWTVVAATILSIFLVYALVVYGVPAASRSIAYKVPMSVYTLTTDHSMTILDKTLFDPSELSAQRQQAITQKFNQLTKDINWANGFNLKFRTMGYDGKTPNAMALPSGILIVTDGLVNLAESDEEILAVLAHEVGHVMHRHGITAIIQASILTFSVTFLTGELTGVSELLINNSVLLTQLSYSRDLEKEADLYAKNLIKQSGIGSPQLLVNMLQKLEKQFGDYNQDDDSKSLSDYFSSHPLTQERSRYLLE